MANINLDEAVHYHYDRFPPINLDYSRFMTTLLSATDMLARYDQMLKNMHNSAILLAPLQNQEAVISSRIEGTISTMDEILMFEANDESEDDPHVRSDVLETILYQRALVNAQKAMEQGYPLSQHLVKGIHQQLLSLGRGASKSPGKYKNEQNFLADKSKRKILFVPISPEKLNDGLEELFRFIDKSAEPILIKTAIAHLEFEALHPFQDGNGRIGRMLITLLLWSKGAISSPHFYISGYLEDNKDEYIDTMRHVSATNDWETWCEFFFKAIEQQALRNLQIVENIQSLYDRMKLEFAQILSSKWSVNALDYIFTNPIFKNSRFTSRSGIPAPTANRFTKVLVEKGLLRVIEEASGRKSALYSFEPLMELVRV